MRKVEYIIANVDQTKTPNHVLELIAFFNTLYQLKIFLLLIKYLQDLWHKEFINYQAGLKVINDQEALIINIPMSQICNPSEYGDVKEAIIKMAKIICKIKYKEFCEYKVWYGSLFSVSISDKPNNSSIVKINMNVVVARLFINFCRNEKREPIYYSKINTNIRLITKSKNTIKLYIYLCLWRNVNFLRKNFVEICDTLGLPKSYYNPNNFKKHIIEVAYPVLKKFGDVWYELEDTKISKNNKNEYILECKIYTKENAENEALKKNNIINMMKLHFNLNEKDISDISDIISSTSTKALSEKIIYINDNLKGVHNKAEYVKKALINEFK